MATALALSLAACSTGVAKSSAAPPVVACGQTLYSGAAGATVDDITESSTPIRSVTAGWEIFLRVSDSCSTGSSVAFNPASAATIVKSADAGDGRPVFVIIQPLAKDFTVTAHEGDRTYSVAIRLQEIPSASAASAMSPPATSP